MELLITKANQLLKLNLRPKMDDTCHQTEALGSFDHGIEPYDIGLDDRGPKVQSVQVRSLLLNFLLISLANNLPTSIIDTFTSSHL